MASSTGAVGWSRDGYWQQPSTYASHYGSNHLPLAAVPLDPQVVAAPATACAQETSRSDSSEGGDYPLRSHEVIASKNSLYEVLETLGKLTGYVDI